MGMKSIAGLAMTVSMLIASTMASATTWQLDPSKTQVNFATTGVGGGNGKFTKMTGDADFNPAKPQDLKLNLTIQSDSLDAGLKTPLYKGTSNFDVQHYKTIVFKTTKVTQTAPNQLTVSGDLTMKGVTRPVQWKVNLVPNSNPKLFGFKANTTVNRSNWGITGSQALVNDPVQLDVAATLNAK